MFIKEKRKKKKEKRIYKFFHKKSKGELFKSVKNILFMSLKILYITNIS